MFDYPDMLLLFAAGNEGAYGKESVGAPALAKNSISVGSMVTRVAKVCVLKNRTPINYQQSHTFKCISFPIPNLYSHS